MKKPLKTLSYSPTLKNYCWKEKNMKKLSRFFRAFNFFYSLITIREYLNGLKMNWFECLEIRTKAIWWYQEYQNWGFFRANFILNSKDSIAKKNLNDCLLWFYFSLDAFIMIYTYLRLKKIFNDIEHVNHPQFKRIIKNLEVVFKRKYLSIRMINYECPSNFINLRKNVGFLP